MDATRLFAATCLSFGLWINKAKQRRFSVCDETRTLLQYAVIYCLARLAWLELMMWQSTLSFIGLLTQQLTIKLIGVFPALLGQIHCVVGLFDKLADLIGVIRKKRNTETTSDMALLPA